MVLGVMGAAEVALLRLAGVLEHACMHAGMDGGWHGCGRVVVGALLWSGCCETGRSASRQAGRQAGVCLLERAESQTM
jgi:hypothetical protein